MWNWSAPQQRGRRGAYTSHPSQERAYAVAAFTRWKKTRWTHPWRSPTRPRTAPRALLRSVPGIELIDPPEWEICCGSAGVYNLLQPEAAAELGRRKADNLLGTGAEAIAAANPGCALQIAAHLEQPIPVLHPMTLLDHSIRTAP